MTVVMISCFRPMPEFLKSHFISMHTYVCMYVRMYVNIRVCLPLSIHKYLIIMKKVRNSNNYDLKVAVILRTCTYVGSAQNKGLKLASKSFKMEKHICTFKEPHSYVTFLV